MRKKITYLLCAGILFGCVVGCDDYEVKEIPKSIYVNQESVDLFVGEQRQLKASPTDGTYTYSWTSEDPSVATVSTDGLVQAVGEGSTNIIVKGGSARIIVPVTAVIRIPLEDVQLSEGAMELFPGQERNVIVNYVPVN